MKCSNCGSSSIETDISKGTVYCISCGTVHEENSVVSSLNFTETSNGSSVLTGQIIKITENYTKVGTSFISTNNTYVQNTIRSICVSLGLSDDHVSSSFRWYKLSLQHNLTKGRSLLYTLSAVIYITCRQEKTPHLLIDFSVLLRIDVFKIGRTFLKITNLLNIKVPLIDPSLYLPRFVNKLKMSEKVLCLANRIVSRMKRDWIVVGRRPNNLCGASLVVAGRILDEVRGISEVARIVHVSVVTIKKRLKEMAATASANLSINEFCNLWLEKEEDPPVNKEEKIDLTINTPEELSEEKEYKLKKFEDFAEKIKPIENKENINLRKEKDLGESYNGYLEENKENINLRKEKNSMESYNGYLEENKENINPNENTVKNTEESLKSSEENINPNDNTVKNTEESLKSSKENINPINKIEENTDENILIKGRDDLFKDNELHSLNCGKDTDSDINNFILSNEESKHREILWNEMYGEFMKQKAERPIIYRKKTYTKRNKNIQFETITDAVKSVVKEKKFSSKINYSVIERMFE